MPDPEDKVREHIRSIETPLYTDLVDEAYSTVWGYLLALSDFKLSLSGSVRTWIVKLLLPEKPEKPSLQRKIAESFR
jgi:hypothetical protein